MSSRGLDASEIVDPRRRVDDDHAVLLLNSATPGLVKITFPVNFASGPPDRGLGVRLHPANANPLLRLLSSSLPAVPHRLAYQAVVNVYVSPPGLCPFDV
jgi:hypothetical protein